MPRVITTSNATVVQEYVSPVTTVHWDPLSNSGTLTFNVEEFLFINGEFVQRVFKTSTSISLYDLINREYDVEVAPGITQKIPGGLIMLAFKKAFEVAVEEGKVVVDDATQTPPTADETDGAVAP